VLLVGGAVTFAAGQALDNGPTSPPAATVPAPPALTLLAPTRQVTRDERATLAALRPQGLRADQAYSVRIYVNGAQVREHELPAAERFELPNIPLVQGPNVIGATLVGDGGEGPRSAEMTVVRDDVQPDIQISQPAPRSTVYSETVLLRGRTEAGATLTVSRAGSEREFDATLHDDGRFSALVDLDMGSNTFVIRVIDPAGNRASTRVTLDRGESAARLTLDISVDTVDVATLPAAVILTATVRDEVGHLVDGVEVTFGVSPPDSSTATYRVTAEDGRARWSDLTVAAGDATGVWLVTVSATLPSGVELRQDGTFSVE
jgi:hypothetical protein